MCVEVLDLVLDHFPHFPLDPLVGRVLRPRILGIGNGPSSHSSDLDLQVLPELEVAPPHFSDLVLQVPPELEVAPPHSPDLALQVPPELEVDPLGSPLGTEQEEPFVPQELVVEQPTDPLGGYLVVVVALAA